MHVAAAGKRRTAGAGAGKFSSVEAVVLFVSVLFASATTSEKVTEDDDPATPIDTAEGDEMLHMYTISAMPLKTTSASMTFSG